MPKRERPEHELAITYVEVHAVEQHPENANNGDVDLIQESIQVNGLYQPILVQRSSGYIIVGNHRYLAAVRRGMTTIPVIYLDIGDEEARRIMVVDNRSARVGHDDEGLLANLLESLYETNDGLAGTGYRYDDYSALMELVNEPITADDFREPEEELPPKPELGRLNFTINPVVDDNGEVYEFVVAREQYRRLTANDLNVLRHRMGQDALNSFQLASYDVPSWRKG